MFKSGEEILAELDATLEQLLLNAQTIHHISVYSLSENEMRAMQKTQESLLARFVHTNELLNEKERKRLSEESPKIYESMQEKLRKFGKLNASFINQLSHQFKTRHVPKKTRIGKNRSTLKVG